ncbi:MAG: hypothetical protein O7E57_18750 [Gammaproteobacteria bacterium]|nr:hypothetical protein [Gammaproteobacteria bacterium]
MIRASAPGKVVLWGEYAVLRGAPAMVMAVNREAICTVNPQVDGAGDGWQFESLGFESEPACLGREELTGGERPPESSAAALAWHVLQTINHTALPTGGRVITDSRLFYEAGDKLGIGSSAAICTALLGSFAAVTGQPPTYAAALAAHSRAQGGRGSGIDVAAAFHGGLLKFQNKKIEAAKLPAGLNMTFIWTGRPARTRDHLEPFSQWLETADLTPLSVLRETAESLFATNDILRDLSRYTACLKVLDNVAGLGIYSPAHKHLEHLAKACEVVYKPCGAGGGDVGVAFGDRIASLEDFAHAATVAGFRLIPLEKAEYGIRVTR